jgi:uncharacterized protein (TIGR02147 family)
MKKKAVSIYAYNDFRNFLHDYQESRQGQEPDFTKSEFSRRLRLPHSRSYFFDVLNGKKVTTTFIDRFVSVMGLKGHESQYFRVLVKFNQAESVEERELYFGQLVALNRTPTSILSKDLFIYYKDWYNSIIRAILNVYDFKDDYKKLGQRIIPAITPKQARQSIKLLKKLGLIQLDRSGFWRPSAKSISAPEFVKDEIIRQFQLQCLEFARMGVLRKDDQRQVVATNTLSISAQGYDRLIKHIQQFRSLVRSLASKDESPADRVYQLSLLLIPFSRKV